MPPENCADKHACLLVDAISTQHSLLLDLDYLLALQDLGDKSALPPESSERLLEKSNPNYCPLEAQLCKGEFCYLCLLAPSPPLLSRSPGGTGGAGGGGCSDLGYAVSSSLA